MKYSYALSFSTCLHVCIFPNKKYEVGRTRSRNYYIIKDLSLHNFKIRYDFAKIMGIRENSVKASRYKLLICFNF
jgi:hypothetical protein